MATQDIRVDVNIFDHPKILELEETLGGPAAFKALLRLWAFAAQNHQDGDLSSMTSKRIALAAKWPIAEADKFVEALQSAGLLDGSRIHDWLDRQPFVATAPARTHAARIAAKARWDKKIMRGASGSDAALMRVASNRNAPTHISSLPYPDPSPNPDPSPDPDLRPAQKPSAAQFGTAEAWPPAKPSADRGQDSLSSRGRRSKVRSRPKAEQSDPAKLEAAIAKERERTSGGLEALKRIGERMGFTPTEVEEHPAAVQTAAVGAVSDDDDIPF